MKNQLGYALVILIFFSLAFSYRSKERISETETIEIPVIDQKTASNFAQIALHCIQREYPNKLSHVMNDSSEVLSPQELHPSFYGCFDWHSSVHGHWMLVRLLKVFPDIPESQEIRNALNQNLSAKNINIEVDYLHQPSRKSFERTYGWSWLLKLSSELYTWDDPDGNKWLENLEPLALAIEERYIDFLPKQDFPIRRGVHANTAFGLTFALDYARIANKKELEDMIISSSKKYYLGDKNSPSKWEPDGDDFLSPSLIEADLMGRILDSNSFEKWFKAYFPDALKGKPENLFTPAPVSDRSDPKIVHLDGLNLSRAWCMFRISNTLPEQNLVKKVLYESGMRHAEATLPHIASGNYEGEHWLASFAVYMFSCME